MYGDPRNGGLELTRRTAAPPSVGARLDVAVDSRETYFPVDCSGAPMTQQFGSGFPRSAAPRDPLVQGA